jgi:dihydroflavonol-4-reductase
MGRVLLTGATGFVGVHTIQQLLAAGHSVRAFARSPERLAAHLAPLGVDASDPRIDLAVGVMTDRDAVRGAADGCEAVIHAAATFSFKRRDRRAMERENALGTRVALEAGAEAGCRILVQVSSTTALARPGGVTLDHASPLGPGLGPYTASKVASERVARELQESGAPVTIVNPGAIIGPHDPYVGESNALIRAALLGKQPAYPRGLLHFVDVRDTAATLVAALAHPAGERLPVPGTGSPDLTPVLAEVTGRRLKVLLLPARFLVPVLAPGYLTGWSWLPGEVEGIRIIACGNPVDASRTTELLGVRERPLLETVADTVRWMAAAGHIPAKAAGRAAA